MMQKTEEKVKELANKTARYHALSGKVEITKLV